MVLVTDHTGRAGRADIVYFNTKISTIEVYEIKPFRSYGPEKPYNINRRDQMLGYVSAIKENYRDEGWDVKLGTTLNNYFNKIVIPSKLFKNKEIVYCVYEDGMITYYYRNKQPKKRE